MTPSLSVNFVTRHRATNKIRDFQRKLYLKAKQEPEIRFHALYDKICSMCFLREAYRRVKANGGSPGVDGVTFVIIEAQGLESYHQALQHELQTKTYRPSPVLRVYILKPNGKLRPLGIPTLKDRIAQMSCKLVIEPIFEADFEDSSYGFRPKRSAHDAIAAIKGHLQAGRTHIFDADLSQYFDTIPHDKLMILLAARISDGATLHLLKMWLKAPVMEQGRMSGGKSNNVGTPQGGVISPLLANVYLNPVDRLVNRLNSLFARYGVRIVRYADDFVLMGRQITDAILDKLKQVLNRLGLKLNEDKSRLVDAVKEPFGFLGFTFRHDKDRFGRNRKYWNVLPSQKSCQKIRDKVAECLQGCGHFSAEALVKELNPILRGWINYFAIPKVSYPQQAKRNLRYYLMEKLDRYYARKSQRRCRLYGHRVFDKLVKKFNLIDPAAYQPSSLCACECF